MMFFWKTYKKHQHVWVFQRNLDEVSKSEGQLKGKQEVNSLWLKAFGFSLQGFVEVTQASWIPNIGFFRS